MTVFGRHSGQETPTGSRVTAEELDFIPSTRLRSGINYEIKYRLGHDGAEEAEE